MTDDIRRWQGPVPAPGAAELADRFAASQLVKVHALGIDMRDSALTRSVFADEATAEGARSGAVIDEHLRVQHRDRRGRFPSGRLIVARKIIPQWSEKS